MRICLLQREIVGQKAKRKEKSPSSEEPGLKSHPADLNCRPADYESAALPAELEWHRENKCSNNLEKFLYLAQIFFKDLKYVE